MPPISVDRILKEIDKIVKHYDGKPDTPPNKKVKREFEDFHSWVYTQRRNYGEELSQSQQLPSPKAIAAAVPISFSNQFASSTNPFIITADPSRYQLGGVREVEKEESTVYQYSSREAMTDHIDYLQNKGHYLVRADDGALRAQFRNLVKEEKPEPEEDEDTAPTFSVGTITFTP